MQELRESAHQNKKTPLKNKKSSKQKGLYKQVHKALTYLETFGPRYPGLHCHPYSSIASPYDPDEKVFEAYVQNHTPGAYRIFWCYGPKKGQITIVTIIPHP